METAALKTKSPPLRVWTPLFSLLPLWELRDMIRNIKHSRTWITGNQNAMILLKRSGKEMVLAAFHEGTDIVSYQANDSITFQIIEGSLKFNSRKASATIAKGQVMTVNGNVKYRLTTSENTVLLMSVTKNSLMRA